MADYLKELVGTIYMDRQSEYDEMQLLETSDRTCLDCENLTTQVCKRCEKAFCLHYASKVDFQFCIYCLSDVTLEDSIIRKTVETKSLSGKKIFTRVMTARRLMFTGADWMFAQARVITLSDAELETTIEYHRAIMGEMLDEREARKIAKNKLALKKMIAGMSGASLKIPTRGGVNTDGTTIGEAQVIRETRKTKPEAQVMAAQSAVSAVMAMLRAKGLSEAQIKAALVSMAKAKS